MIVARLTEARALLHRDSRGSRVANPMSSRSNEVLAGSTISAISRPASKTARAPRSFLAYARRSQPVEVLMVMKRIAARPVDQADVGIISAPL